MQLNLVLIKSMFSIYRQEDASGDMGVGAGRCRGKVCSLLSHMRLMIVCLLSHIIDDSLFAESRDR